MAKRPVSIEAEPQDTTELRALVSDAATQFQCAVEQFYELGHVLEAIAGRTQNWSTERGLANLGARLADENAAHLELLRERYSMEAERHGS
ncbi:hypothetical protein [Paraburkholderia sp. MM6662-R1]|uniref:hypothetical protein n=1 Tax=Paraburkholderia sp. MM6662-R1 TaxID=2991066 RepID=UPI003D22C13F